MDIAHDILADAMGADKTRFSHQVAVTYVLLTVGAWFFYLFFASCTFTYFFLWNRDKYFPSTIKRSELWAQVRHEIWIAVSSVPFMSLAMLPATVFSYRGYSKVYSNVADYGVPYLLVSPFLFLAFTDMLIYWAHRGLHHPYFYKHIHKLHHVYKFTTPYSSHAFHPLDGFTQGVPYYIFAYLFPIHNVLFMAMFMAVNFWTISIHDQVDFGGRLLNSTGHHTIHHEQFNYNYGQYFTFWDRVGGTYRPAVQTHTSPLYAMLGWSSPVLHARGGEDKQQSKKAAAAAVKAKTA